MRKTLGIALALALAAAAPARAVIVTQWNFNSVPPDASNTTGTTVPSIGLGTASTVGGITDTFSNGNANGGSTDPDVSTNDSGWQTTGYAAPGVGSGTTGIEFDVSTFGFTNILLSFDTRHSNTSSRFVQVQYSTDGINYSANGLAGDGIFVGNAGDTWFNNRSVDFSSVAGVNNNPLFSVRMVAVFDPAGNNYLSSNGASTYASAGTLRWDMVTISGTVVPEPGTLSLLAIGAVGLIRRRRA